MDHLVFCRTDRCSVIRNDVGHAVAVRDCDDRTVGVARNLFSQTGTGSDVTVIGLARTPWIWSLSLLTGYAAPGELEQATNAIAAKAALSVVEALPTSVCARYLVSRSWWRPCLRRYLQQSGCHELVVCGRRDRM